MSIFSLGKKIGLVLLLMLLVACGGNGGPDNSPVTSVKAVWDQSNWDEKNWQ